VTVRFILSDTMESKASFLERSNVVLHDDLEFWMTRLPVPLKEVPVIYLAIPGTFKS